MKIVAIGLAVICFAAAALYGTGHMPGSHHVPHMKHAIALGLLGVLALVWARMQGSTQSSASV